MPDSISYFANAAGDEAGVTDASDDDIGLLILQHSGFRGDGVTKSTDKIYFNITHTIDANAGAVGDMILKPGEIWWARFAHSDIDDISVEASANDIKLLVYAVVDDGGV